MKPEDNEKIALLFSISGDYILNEDLIIIFFIPTIIRK